MAGTQKKIRVWVLIGIRSGLSFTSTVNLVFTQLGANRASSVEDQREEFKGKQDLLVHLRALAILGSYCLHLDNPGM